MLLEKVKMSDREQVLWRNDEKTPFKWEWKRPEFAYDLIYFQLSLFQRTFCIMGQRVNLCGMLKLLNGGVAKASYKSSS